MYTEKRNFKQKLKKFSDFQYLSVYNTNWWGIRQVEKKPAAETAAGADYFFRKDMQSVHWSMVGFASWVPTMILSREQ